MLSSDLFEKTLIWKQREDLTKSLRMIEEEMGPWSFGPSAYRSVDFKEETLINKRVSPSKNKKFKKEINLKLLKSNNPQSQKRKTNQNMNQLNQKMVDYKIKLQNQISSRSSIGPKMMRASRYPSSSAREQYGNIFASPLPTIERKKNKYQNIQRRYSQKFERNIVMFEKLTPKYNKNKQVFDEIPHFFHSFSKVGNRK